jgi:hypothetical protein
MTAPDTCNYGVVLCHNIVDGEFTQEFQLRLDYSVQLYRSGKINKLLLTGGPLARGKDEQILSKTVSQLSQEYVISKGVSENHTLREDQSLETVGNIIFARNILEEHSANHITIITCQYHIPRARTITSLIFGKQFTIDYEEIPFNELEGSVEREQTSTKAFTRTFAGVTQGNLSESLERLYTAHPLYLNAEDGIKQEQVQARISLLKDDPRR